MSNVEKCVHFVCHATKTQIAFVFWCKIKADDVRIVVRIGGDVLQLVCLCGR